MEWIKNWFSNMMNMDSPLIEDGISYRTVEHYYVAHKTNDLSIRKLISFMKAGEAKKFGRSVVLAPDFEKNKLAIMERALRWKFAPGTSWYNKLMATGSEEIVERNNWGDCFWGWDVNKKRGENHLGKILMKIRDGE
jgi:N-glycosidase YbiA